MTDQEDFLPYIGDQVQALMQKWSLSEGKAFMMWYAMNGLEMDETTALDAVSYDGPNDKDIDLFYLDDENERVLIGQGKFQTKGEYKATKNELLGLLHTTDWLDNPEVMKREGRADIAAAAQDYHEGVARGYAVHYQYVYLVPCRKK